MESFAERLRWILKERGWSEREYCRLAGVSPSQVSGVLRQLDQTGRSNVAMWIVVKLANAAGVTVGWLATGEGARDVPPDELIDAYMGRRRAVRAARELGLAEEAIAQVRAETLSDGASKGARWWFDRIAALDTLVRSDDSSPPDPTSPPKASGWRRADKTPPTRRSHRS